ncbi:hypothetical protein B0A48_02126 [Cryoendolithus antarcticus]|uniref:Uncharacterized protein n=1 Tax=Cryoendolithus antarcticus TaxID=1507870 RepID=A0A1V8TMQ7_9PEZI|nr:hypothetical protein B0A48_02126 [Cryoendolithus antarcticus]
MARPRKVSMTTTAEPLPTKAKTSSPDTKGRASQRKATPSAKVAESAADTGRISRVTKSAAAKGVASPSKRATSQTASPPKGAACPAKRAASSAKRAVSPAKPRKAPNPALLLRLARSASPAKASARANAKSTSSGPQFTGDGVTEVYTNWDLEQFEPVAKRAIENIDSSFPPLKVAWSLLRDNAFLDGRAKAGDTSAAVTAKTLYRALKKATKQDMGPEFDDAWKKGVTAAKLRSYLESTGEDIRDNALTPIVTPPRGRPVAPRSPGKASKVQEGRVAKAKSPSKVRKPSKVPSPTKTRSQSPLKKVNSGDSGVVIIDKTKETQGPDGARPKSPAKGKGKAAVSPARPYTDNRGCRPETRGNVKSCTNPELIIDEKGNESKHNPFFETLPAPEVWHRRMPPYFPFGETPLMEAYVSRQIDEDLQRGIAHDEEVQNKNRSVVGRVFNAGQKAASYMGSIVPWKRSEDRRYPPAWSLPEVEDSEIAAFARIGNGKASVRKSSRG